MEEPNDERDSPLRRQILESSKKNASDPSKRGISYNEMADIEQYLLQEKGIKTIDERVEYLKGINIDDIDPQLTKLGLKSTADRDQMVKRENELKAVLKNNPLAASLQQMKSTVERINSTPVMPLPNFPEIKSPLESIEKAAWERHNQLRDLQQDTYDVLAAIADSNQNLLNEQRRVTKITWAVLVTGIILTFGVPISAMLMNASLIYNPVVWLIIAAVALVWTIAIRYLTNEPSQKVVL
jgi:hypothetical protein